MNIQSNEDNLSEKEQLFCRYLLAELDLKQGALKAGYKSFPEKTALRLIQKPRIKREIERLKKEKLSNSRNSIQCGYERLAYGRISDCIKLLFSQNAELENFENMDFFNISEVKKGKDGGMEIKFFDRFKALEKLNELSEKEISNTPALYKALMNGVKALNDKDD